MTLSAKNHYLANNTHVVIQAGGKGLRMGRLTEDTPKPLLKINDKPIIENILKRIIQQKFNKITIIANYQSNTIFEYIESQKKSFLRNVDVSIYEEKQALGNVGSLNDIPMMADTMLLVFGDLITEIDYLKLVKFHILNTSDITLASHILNYQLKFGEVCYDGKSVITYKEKPQKQYLICSGVACFNKPVINLLKELPKPCGISDLVNTSLKNKNKVLHWQHNYLWYDINSVDDIEKMNTKNDWHI